MMRRCLVGLVVAAAAACGVALAEETRGTITKIEDGTLTVRVSNRGKGKGDEKAETKAFKFSKDVKITRAAAAAKDEKAVELTLDELKTAAKVTDVSVTLTHDGENVTEVKTRAGGGFGRGKNKKDDK